MFKIHINNLLFHKNFRVTVHYHNIGSSFKSPYSQSCGSPYYSNAEVNSMLSDIDDFWTVTPANLRTMASGIESKFGF